MSEIISSLPGENINIENEIHNTPTNIKPNFLFLSSPLNNKNIPTNNIKKYQTPKYSPHFKSNNRTLQLVKSSVYSD